MKSLYNVKDLPNKSSQEFKDNTDKSIIITEKNYDITLLNKSAKITEKNYDLPLKRENLEIPLKRDYKEISLKKESLEIPLKRESLEIPGNFQNKNNNSNDINRTIQKSHTLKPKPCQKDYSKKLTCLRNKENEIQKHQQLPTRQKNLTILDPNRSMFLEPNHDYTTIKSKEISTTKSKLSSKSPKIIKKPEFLKRNRSISKQDKTNTTSNNFIKNLGLEAQETIKNLSPTNNHLTINNMIGVLNLPTSIECTICKKIINVTDFMDHLSHCSTHLVENPSDSNHQTIFSDISNIQNNLSFNTSTENQELVEKRQRHIGTIHESIPNDRVLNRKTDENFFSLAPGFNLESDIGGNFIKNESNRYGDSPSNVNMTNEFSTSHRKGLIQDNLINSSFVIKSMNEIKRNSKK